jgi:hypothetical protein
MNTPLSQEFIANSVCRCPPHLDPGMALRRRQRDQLFAAASADTASPGTFAAPAAVAEPFSPVLRLFVDF